MLWCPQCQKLAAEVQSSKEHRRELEEHLTAQVLRKIMIHMNVYTDTGYNAFVIDLTLNAGEPPQLLFIVKYSALY